MKKRLFTAILLLCVLFSLPACGKAPQQPVETAPTPVSEIAPEETPAPAVPEVGGDAPQTEAPEVGDDAPAFDEESFNAALELKGQDVALLFDAIGEPSGSSYAPSCIGGAGEDGELYYEGFYVATFRNEGKEIVWDVISDVG